MVGTGLKEVAERAGMLKKFFGIRYSDEFGYLFSNFVTGYRGVAQKGHLWGFRRWVSRGGEGHAPSGITQNRP